MDETPIKFTRIGCNLCGCLDSKPFNIAGSNGIEKMSWILAQKNEPNTMYISKDGSFGTFYITLPNAQIFDFDLKNKLEDSIFCPDCFFLMFTEIQRQDFIIDEQNDEE